MTCTHHWLIDSPQGPVSAGTCKLCGETQDFQNVYSPASKYWRQTIKTHGRGHQMSKKQLESEMGEVTRSQR